MRLTIFVVEDDSRIALQFEQALVGAGFDVVMADSAEQAVRLIESGPAPAALVTDVRLPAMSGWDFARHARRCFPNLPVLYVSGDSCGDWEREGVANSVMAEKPLVATELLDRLRLLLNPDRQAR